MLFLVLKYIKLQIDRNVLDKLTDEHVEQHERILISEKELLKGYNTLVIITNAPLDITQFLKVLFRILCIGKLN